MTCLMTARLPVGLLAMLVEEFASGLSSPGLVVPGQAEEEDSEGEDDFIYNPLKLPMGWDGKPIPYWLYKLHGLNQVRRRRSRPPPPPVPAACVGAREEVFLLAIARCCAPSCSHNFWKPQDAVPPT